METGKRLVVFKLQYRSGENWGAISNFITKFSENLPIEASDVRIVSSYASKKKGQSENFSLVKEAHYYWDRFQQIGKPENIYIAKEQYEYVFLISIAYEQLYDVVELQSLYLILNACRSCRILALISGKSEEYFKTSHFFSSLTEDKGFVYERIFFVSDKIRHLQISGIGVLSRFLPLVPVDALTDHLLRQCVNKYISAKLIGQLLQGREMEQDTKRIFTGALKQLSRFRGILEHCESNQCADYLGNLTVLSFLLFSFSLEGKVEKFSGFEELKEELQAVSVWANGCMQLIENIVFHSGQGKGAFSFRLLEGEAAYIKEKYALSNDQGKWIELMITDYPGTNRTLNLAEKFRKNLDTDDVRASFDRLAPRDFFITEYPAKSAGTTFGRIDHCAGKTDEAWRNYYSEKKNVINHYGLRIFQNVVKSSGGHFMVQSHSAHCPKAEEFFCSDDWAGNQPEMCLPGTGYSILFPVGLKKAREKFNDYGIEDYENKLIDGGELFAYTVIPKELPVDSEVISAREKENLITRIAARLQPDNALCDIAKQQAKCVGDTCDRIISINAKSYRGNQAEVIYKSIILAMFQCDDLFHVVLYGCQAEFAQMFLDACFFGWRNMQEGLCPEPGRQIVLYTGELYEEIVILPEDWNQTLQVNHFSNFFRETRWKNYFEKYGKPTVSYEGIIRKYPFDILVGEDQNSTIFECYVKAVVNRNIQELDLGCKMENIHMRLGSTIHVNHFYEAEVLFGNVLFVERFALLMIKKMIDPKEGEPVSASDRITLYGYTNYSEQTVFRTMQYLHEVLPGIDVDYAILERESEDRGFAHVDRIRYSTYFQEGEQGEEERRKHFQQRKIICIIPIASTLKTNEKMINLFAEENGKECRALFKRNFELILVGSIGENKYWEKKGKRIVGKPGMEISPEPEFFVEVQLEYMEPLECTMCFPGRLIDEQPLIETNAASTIPNQAFGLLSEAEETCRINWETLRKAEDELEILRDTLLYRHLEQNENHFLFYFQMERLVVRYPDQIHDWLKGVKDKIKIMGNDYVILFCPAHFGNAGFVEFVNHDVFGDRAVVIRDDVNKEYRCNFKTKFSNLRKFVEKVAYWNKNNSDDRRRIRLFYVDYAIVTGRTFQRAKSLAQSILEDFEVSDSQRYAVFDGIFVLADRNSRFSRWQYTGVNKEEHLYAFRTIYISSIRNHGDACVYCNLARESGILKKSAISKKMEKYWRQEEEKFRVKPLEAYLKEGERKQEKLTEATGEKNRRAFRRLVCTNNAMIFLDERFHGNRKESVLEQLLLLILEGSAMHKGEEAEYFLSYCKALSRPFRVYDKGVKEAVFDFLLLSCWCALSGEPFTDAIDSIEKKSYLKEDLIKKRLLDIEKFEKNFFASEELKRDLIKVLLKQLTEMKSNFIMRKSAMERILGYAERMNEKEREEFLDYYKYLIKKLTGVSSDTSKSLWLDQMLKQNWESRQREVLQDIYLENVWIYQYTFQKLNERVKTASAEWDNFFDEKNPETISRKLVKFADEILSEYITPYQFKDFISLLQLYELCGGDDKLTEKGKEFVASNFLLYRFISSGFENGLRKTEVAEKGNLTKVDYIASCMEYILAAKEIVIIMEFDAEYDLWENKLIERYNQLLSPGNPEERIVEKLQKEYIILGSSMERKGGKTVKEEELAAARYFRDKWNWAEKGYCIDEKKKIFLWELGHATDYPVYIVARWEESRQDGLSEIGWLNRVRSVMQYYWLLNHAVFNRSNEGFLYEIARQRKKNAIHSRRKAHTHTKSDIKLAQYNHMLEKERYDQYYQSDLLLLLADLNVSEHYRNSLTVDYYLNRERYRIGRWNSRIALFTKKKEFFVINSDMEEETGLVVSKKVLFEGDLELPEDERIVILDHTNAERELFLLIYSLMVNAITDGRGHVENNSVTVYCSKTSEGYLRIANEVGDNQNQKTAEQIMEELKYPPEEENQGISLWSMSRYIKCIIAHILDKKIEQIENMAASPSDEILAQLRSQMLMLLGEEFQIRVKKEIIEGKNYFSVLLPIFAEKYGI